MLGMGKVALNGYSSLKRRRKLALSPTRATHERRNGWHVQDKVFYFKKKKT